MKEMIKLRIFTKILTQNENLFYYERLDFLKKNIQFLLFSRDIIRLHRSELPLSLLSYFLVFNITGTAIGAIISGSAISFIILRNSFFLNILGSPIIPSLAGATIVHVIDSYMTQINNILNEKALEKINNQGKSIDM